jgi:hypothetical protein
VLGLEFHGFAMDLRCPGVHCRLVPVRVRLVGITCSLSLAFRLVLMLQRARLALPRALLSGPRFRNQFWVGHTCQVPTAG